LLSAKADPWTEIGLTLPILLGYHIGVIFLPTINAADFVTTRLVALVSWSKPAYLGLTLAIAAAFVAAFVFLGKRTKLDWRRFAVVAAEGAVYAVVMCTIARFVVGSLRLAGAPSQHGFFSGLIMSLGAGFYEELAFRVVLFGLGLLLLQRFIKIRPTVLLLSWALVSVLIFSGWHYVGTYGDPFQLASFTFRTVCGLAFVAIYRLRGFAPAVWCHALYDIWVLAL